jgi:hypothetical protein
MRTDDLSLPDDMDLLKAMVRAWRRRRRRWKTKMRP